MNLLPLAVSITLAWDASPDAISYNLYVGIQSIKAGNHWITFYPTTFTQLDVNGLDYGTEYFFVVTAWANGLESDFSNEVQYTPMPSPTPTPTPEPTPEPTPTPTPTPEPTPTPDDGPGEHKGWYK